MGIPRIVESYLDPASMPESMAVKERWIEVPSFSL